MINCTILFIENLKEINHEYFKRNFCKNCIKSKRKKCFDFYNSFKNDTVDRVILETCPYGYSVFIFANQIITSIISEKADFNLLNSRNQYYKKQGQKIDEIKTNIVKSDTVKTKLEEYLRFFNEYYSISTFIHDASNSMSSFLDAAETIEDEEPFVELSNAYNLINTQIIKINEIKKKGIPFIYSIDYDNLYETLNKNINQLVDTIYKYFHKINNFSEYNEEPYTTLIYGFDLLVSFYNFHQKVKLNDFSFDHTNVRTHYPHRMMMRLMKVLGYKAKKRRIIIKMTPSSQVELRGFRNSNDIYLALFSLLENAIKHARAATNIIIDISGDIDKTVVSITNQSYYLSMEAMEKIKDKGYRYEGVLSSGSGLGLYLASQIFEYTKTGFELKFNEDDYTFVARVAISDYY